MVNTNTNEVRFTMRINKELYEIIKQNAIRFKRSIAKQIEFELEELLLRKN